jgi:AraC family transcriptional regulator
MPDLALIAQALDFVEAHLREPIGVADMAAAVGYSLYHFCRTFNEATHHTPYDYLMRRRLAEAARALLRTDDRIIDVALDHQFSNPETFSRAFRRVFDTQPSQWRREGRLDPLRLMPRLTPAHLAQIARGPYLRPVLAERPALRLAGLMAPIRGETAVVDELWALLDEALAAPGDRYGLAWYPPGWPQRGYLYLAAVEMHDVDTAHTPLLEKTLPAGSYARFVHKGPRSDLPLTVDYGFHTWLPRSGRSLVQPLVVEHYRQHPLETDDESEIGVYLPLQA